MNVTDAPLRAGPVSNVRLRPEVALPRTAAAAKTSRALVSAAFTKADSVFRDAAVGGAAPLGVCALPFTCGCAG